MTVAMASKPDAQAAADKDWWRGAVIYQIYPRSFQDSNGDGVLDASDAEFGSFKLMGANADGALPARRQPTRKLDGSGWRSLR